MIQSGLSCVAIFLICVTSVLCSNSFGDSPQVESKSEPKTVDEYTGKWTIRFFRVDSNPIARPEDILFGCWQLSFDQMQDEQVRGTIEWDGWPLRFEGTASYRTDQRITFEASGKIEDDTWSIRCEGARQRQVSPNDQLTSSLMGTALISSQLSRIKGGQSVTVPCHWIAIKQMSAKHGSIAWKLQGVDDSLFDSNEINRTTVLVFSKGFSCVHCNEQMNLLNQHFTDFFSLNAEVVFVVSDTLARLEDAISDTKIQFRLLSDPTLAVFRKYGLDENHRSHGIVLVDANRDIKWSVSSSTPFMDVADLLRRVEEVGSKK